LLYSTITARHISRSSSRVVNPVVDISSRPNRSSSKSTGTLCWINVCVVIAIVIVIVIVIAITIVVTAMRTKIFCACVDIITIVIVIVIVANIDDIHI